MEKTKNSKGLIWLIIILIILILGLVGFIVYDKVLSSNNNKVDLTKSSTTQPITTNDNKETQLDNKNTLKKETFTYNLNNKEQKITYIYKYKTSSDYYSKEEYADMDVEIYKEQDEYVYKYIYLEILVNGTKIENVELPLYYDTQNIETDKLIDNISLLTSDTINSVKGTDKEYFVFTIEHQNLITDGGTDPLIVNDDGKLIYTLKFEDSSSLWSLDETSKFYFKENDPNYKTYIIDDTKIYYITGTIDKEIDYNYDDNTFPVQENYITINNDKIEITEGPITRGMGAGVY